MNKIIPIKIKGIPIQIVKKKTPIEHNESEEYKLQGINQLNKTNSIIENNINPLAHLLIFFILLQIFLKFLAI